MDTLEIFFEQDNAPCRWSKQKTNASIRAKYQDLLAKDKIKDATSIRMHGGEPFFKNKIEKYLEEANEQALIIIETNGSKIDAALIKKFQNVVVHLKIDAVGPLQEYIRPGIEWLDIEKTISTLKTNNIKFAIKPCLHVLNILSITKLKQWCDENSYEMIEPELLKTPEELTPYNLPYQLKLRVPDEYKQALEGQPTADPLNLINELDRDWRSSVKSVIPEWQQVHDNLHWQQFGDLKKIDKDMEKYVG